MPLYEYKCPVCGYSFDLIHNSMEGHESDCPICGAKAKRLMSVSSVHYKGSGFYNTDDKY
jgi:putative FmdB family regulatory protein